MAKAAKSILVTGANGQLGSVLKELAPQYPQFNWLFTDVAELDITSEAEVKNYFNLHTPKYLINCAAYTAVDKAESEPKLAEKLNAIAPGILAEVSKLHKAVMLHVSTDYVFDGIASEPYQETDYTNPTGVYGRTKAEGEENVLHSGAVAYVLRTSWLYSIYGHNFLKTMLKLGAERDTLNVVSDQIGTPTLANDLADALLTIIVKLNDKQKVPPGIYHYSNAGVCSWYDFAHHIMQMAGLNCKVTPIFTHQYPTPAKRPAFSLLNKTKIQTTLGISIPHWADSLQRAITMLKAK